MRTPADFVVTRRLLSQPDASPAEVAAACQLRLSTAARAHKRIWEITMFDEMHLLRHLLDIDERPRWVTMYFRIPNPQRWYEQYPGPRWLSGEVAAALDGFDLVPERWMVYVHPDDLDDALRSAKREIARPAPPQKANLTLRAADPWLVLDPEVDLVERGQRLYDYWKTGHIQLTRELSHG